MWAMLQIDLNVQECDARGDATKYICRVHNFFSKF